MIVDNASTDDTPRLIKSYTHVTFLPQKVNHGFAKGVNIGIDYVFRSFDCAVVVNPDVQVRENWLPPLLSALQKKSVGLVQPRIMLPDGKQVNALGLSITWFGLSYPIGYQSDAAVAAPRFLPAVSGACFALRRDVYELVGGLDENLFLYAEDTEYSWRIRLAGYVLERSDASQVNHHYTFSYTNSRKLFNLEFGRLWLLVTLLSWRSIIVLLPLFAVVELALMVRFPRLNRVLLYRQIWHKRALVSQKRQAVAHLRKKSDREILKDHNKRMNFEPIQSVPIAIFNELCAAYCTVAQVLL